jgi:nitrate reductase assembly molybdenum cofactor insertion protein NarJ
VVRNDVQSVAAALLKPRADYLSRLAGTRDAIASRSAEGARQLTVFLDRISDLSVEELRELHDETFNRRLPAELSGTAGRLAARPATARDVRRALDVLTLALSRLDADRNPLAYVVRALCFLLLARVTSDVPSQPVKNRLSNQSHSR